MIRGSGRHPNSLAEPLDSPVDPDGATMLGLHILRHITARGLAGSLGERMVKAAN
ncbi:MAG: hypothetical protein H0X65_14220 [Gemmatimonadetes bacterium]|nr:hypothetical protein [Gemmatimonadota bacterium]